MSARLPGPGPQVSAGRIRVDAGRAIAKLREYQLADRTHWILEAIRAAVAARAKTITLSGDANDIWLVWEGAPWDLDVLPRLFDELVSPAAGGETQHVRLLAAAVNSALGMNPSYIDVFRIAEEGTHVARYRPDVLERTDELEESPLQQITVEPAKRPENAPVGMAVHLRRRVTLDLIAHFLTRPPEIGVAEAACRDIGVTLKLPDCEMHRDTSPDLLRVPLGEGVDGFIAVTKSVDGEPQLVVAEHGVALARYAFDLVEDTDTGRTTTLPVRVFVDAPRMPTNASRSQVRRDKHPISTAEKAAKKLVPKVIEQLIERVKGGDEEARRSALLWIAGRIAGAQWHVEAPGIRGPLRALAKLPIVRNALGEPRGLAQHWRPEVYRGKEPLPSELTAWLSDMLWAPPNDPAIQLLHGTDERAGRRLVRWAKRQAAAQRKFYAHAKRDVKVVAERRPRIRARLGAEVPGSCIEQQRFENLTGEICVYTEGLGGSVVVLLEGRELERVSLGESIPFDAVIDSARVRPADRYRGVQRDSELARIEKAVHGGVIRAIEALTFEIPPKGYDLEFDASRAEDARLFAQAIGQLKEQGVKLRGPLAKAACWQTTDGRWIGVDGLKGPAIGIVSPGIDFPAPKDRVIVVAREYERGLLAEFASGRLVSYDRAAGNPVLPAKTHAARLAGEIAAGRSCALAVVEGDLVGAIAPSTKSTVQLRHAGVKLQTQARKSRYMQAALVVSSDDIVPDTDWKSAHADAGLLLRDWGSWELALVRAMARAIAGELRPELYVPGTIAIDGPMGIALCEALVEGDPLTLLGNDIIAPLRKVKMVKLHGRRDRASIEDLVEIFPDGQSIPMIVGDHQSVQGFLPMNMPLVVAQAIAKLAGRKCHDASGELARRLRRQQFTERFAEHMARPEDKAPLPTPIHIEAIGTHARGQIGVGEKTSWVRVFVDNRLFRELHVPFGLPIVANLDVGAEQCGEMFDELPLPVASKIVNDVLRAVPRLLVTVGNAKPEALADVGATRRLLAYAAPDFGEEGRKQICGIAAFKTIQGPRVSLETAWSPRGTVRTAAWQEEWLGPAAGEPESAYDEPILSVAAEDTELRTVIEKVPGKPVVDVTDEVVRLQANRRMARGLIPTPKVNGASPELKRSLAQLGAAGQKLGHGELALVDADQSSILLHSQGRFVRAIPFNVAPPVALAIEDHEVGKPEQLRDIQKLVDQFLGEHPLTHTARALAVELVAQVLATPARSMLTPRMLRNLARAVWARRISAKALGDLAAFETLDHLWVPWSKVLEQSTVFGEVWAVTEWTDARPFDDRRLVLLATSDDISNTKHHNVKLIDAREELRLDAIAKRNRARPLVTSLAFPTRFGVFAEAELDGNGRDSPRGKLAILIPSITGNRGVTVHRGMQPLGTMDDPCGWPTMAVIDDASLAPNRTWSEPKADHAWQNVAKLLRRASEELLDAFGDAPDDALVTLRIDHDESAAIKEIRKAHKSQVRGLMWLRGPLDENAVVLTHNLGVTTVRGIPVSGQILFYADGTLDKDTAIEQLEAHAHGKLVRKLVAQADKHAPDVVQAHVVHALALDNVKPTEVRGVQFTCFAPKPLEPRQLAGLLRRHHAVWLIQPGDPAPADDCLIDDGSLTSSVLIRHFAKRLKRYIAQVPPSPAPPQPVTIAEPDEPRSPPPAPPPQPKRQPTRRPEAETPKPKRQAPPPHPIQSLVELVSKRVAQLGLRGYEFRIADQSKPMFQFAYGYLFVAGNNERLRALASQLSTTESAWLPAAIDALAAHVISILNLALTDVTDAAEVDALHLLLRPSPAPPGLR